MNYLFKTNFGWCGISADENVIRRIVLPSHNKRLVLQRLNKPNRVHKNNSGLAPAITGLLKDLIRYFNGEKVDFNNPARYISGLTDASDFERAVYQTLISIPYGRVRSYQWVAQRAGHPKAGRAVGNALAKNPLPIIIPCHRVIKSDDSLGNFSALGGTGLKKKLLELEKAFPPRPDGIPAEKGIRGDKGKVLSCVI
ncbi:MAG: methylated-DNA--[protein]-cysteine S-methyltransferase [Planctomycetes bacterium]|nr:methylated-DNA--[protein]-cysteine S-methyltransferase [Planctomycetota bacterium]